MKGGMQNMAPEPGTTQRRSSAAAAAAAGPDTPDFDIDAPASPQSLFSSWTGGGGKQTLYDAYAAASAVVDLEEGHEYVNKSHIEIEELMPGQSAGGKYSRLALLPTAGSCSHGGQKHWLGEVSDKFCRVCYMCDKCGAASKVIGERDRDRVDAGMKRTIEDLTEEEKIDLGLYVDEDLTQCPGSLSGGILRMKKLKALAKDSKALVDSLRQREGSIGLRLDYWPCEIHRGELPPPTLSDTSSGGNRGDLAEELRGVHEYQNSLLKCLTCRDTIKARIFAGLWDPNNHKHAVKSEEDDCNFCQFLKSPDTWTDKPRRLSEDRGGGGLVDSGVFVPLDVSGTEPPRTMEAVQEVLGAAGGAAMDAASAVGGVAAEAGSAAARAGGAAAGTVYDAGPSAETIGAAAGKTVVGAANIAGQGAAMAANVVEQAAGVGVNALGGAVGEVRGRMPGAGDIGAATAGAALDALGAGLGLGANLLSED
jgi:hypothetical protein